MPQTPREQVQNIPESELRQAILEGKVNCLGALVEIVSSSGKWPGFEDPRSAAFERLQNIDYGTWLYQCDLVCPQEGCSSLISPSGRVDLGFLQFLETVEPPQCVPIRDILLATPCLSEAVQLADALEACPALPTSWRDRHTMHDPERVYRQAEIEMRDELDRNGNYIGGSETWTRHCANRSCQVYEGGSFSSYVKEGECQKGCGTPVAIKTRSGRTVDNRPPQPDDD